MCKREFSKKRSLKNAKSRKLKVSLIYSLFGTYVSLILTFLIPLIGRMIPFELSWVFMLLFFGLSIFLLINTIYITILLYKRKKKTEKE